MNAATILLIAQISRWSRLGDGFRPGSRGTSGSTIVLWAVLGALAALVAIVVMQYRKRNDMSVRCDDPEKLFRELCLAHQLTAGSQRVLRQLAAVRGYQQPADLFLDPAAFDAADLPASTGVNAAAVVDLQSRLF